ncbi:MAG: CPBP family intramembrane metalloprotease [Clostridia bacterium]|nr:CPBP family intramembrane metalloprotease [Clostridia bacterium]
MITKKANQIYSVITIITGLVGLVVISTIFAFFKLDTTSNLYIYISYAIAPVWYILTYFVLTFGFFKIPKTDFISKKDFNPMFFVFGLTAAVSLFFFAILPNNYVSLFIAKIGSSATVPLPQMDNAGNIILANIIICVMPAVAEELMFRKAVCDGLSNIGEIKVIFLSGLIFSLAHFNLAQTVHQFIFGCILAFMYVKTKNIFVTMIMHLVNNALALNLTAFTNQDIWVGFNTTTIVCCAVGLATLVASILLFLLYLKRKKNDSIVINNEENETESVQNEKINVLVFVLIAILVVVWGISLALSLIPSAK